MIKYFDLKFKKVYTSIVFLVSLAKVTRKYMYKSAWTEKFCKKAKSEILKGFCLIYFFLNFIPNLDWPNIKKLIKK